MTTDEIAARLEPRYPAVATMLTEARGELTAVTAFPVSHWRNIWSANPLERVNLRSSGASTWSSSSPTRRP